MRQEEALQQSTGRHRLLALGRWVLGLELALAGGAASLWVFSMYNPDSGHPEGLLLFVVVMDIATLLGGAVLKSWWGLLVLPPAVLVGMAALAPALWGWPSLSFVFSAWFNVLVLTLASAAFGIGVGRLPWNE
jgi:hypothetical protein